MGSDLDEGTESSLGANSTNLILQDMLESGPETSFFLSFFLAPSSGAEPEPPRGISLNSYSMWGYIWLWRPSPANAARIVMQQMLKPNR